MLKIPVDRPLTSGEYVKNNTMVKIKIELAHPLTTPEKVASREKLQTTQQVMCLV